MTILPSSIKNRVEEAFRAARMDVNTDARWATNLIETAIGWKLDLHTRAKVEEIFAHGVTPGHIEKALAVIGEAANNRP